MDSKLESAAVLAKRLHSGSGSRIRPINSSKDAPLQAYDKKSDRHNVGTLDVLELLNSIYIQRFLSPMSPAIMQVLYTVA